MKTPPLLLGAGLLFWGWQAGLFWAGAAAAIAIEAAQLSKLRWAFSQADLDRIWNLCVALFLGGTIYAFFSDENLAAVGDLMKDNSVSTRLATINQSKRSLFQLLQWLPLMFLPITLAQVFGNRLRLDLSTFSWWLRRKRGEPGYSQRYSGGLNVEYPFFACCVFAASAASVASQRTPWFALGLLVLIAWSLWSHRPQRVRTASWAACLIMGLGLAGAVVAGMLQTQKLLQRLDEILLARWTGGRSYNPRENQTRIGTIGQMKLSGRIVLRLETEDDKPPALLREASYTRFHSPYWTSDRSDSDHVNPDATQSNWILRRTPREKRVAKIAGALPGGAGLLPLPNGVSRVEQLPALEVITNLYGSVRVADGPGFVQFNAIYGTGGSIDSPPDSEDLELPRLERSAIEEIARELKLDQLSPADAVLAVERFFAQRFTYSLWQGPRQLATRNRTALARFLLEHRSGHCEYFAAATALLLRAAHIPTRYATGYSVQEKSGRYYVVRERHAHAWCLAWLNGTWQDIDTTPGNWGAEESRRASFWEPVRDALSRLWFEFSKWRWGHAEWKRYLIWLVGPVLAIVLGKLLLQKQWTLLRKSGPAGASPRLWPGLNSAFYTIEERLAEIGFPRQPGETGLAWVARIHQSGAIPTGGLEPLLAAHYRLRFDPRGLSASEEARLRQAAQDWLRSSQGASHRAARR